MSDYEAADKENSPVSSCSLAFSRPHFNMLRPLRSDTCWCPADACAAARGVDRINRVLCALSRPRQHNQTDAITAGCVVVALLFNLAAKNSQKSFPSGVFVVLTFSSYLASPLMPVFFFFFFFFFFFNSKRTWHHYWLELSHGKQPSPSYSSLNVRLNDSKHQLPPLPHISISSFPFLSTAFVSQCCGI